MPLVRAVAGGRYDYYFHILIFVLFLVPPGMWNAAFSSLLTTLGWLDASVWVRRYAKHSVCVSSMLIMCAQHKRETFLLAQSEKRRKKKHTLIMSNQVGWSREKIIIILLWFNLRILKWVACRLCNNGRLVRYVSLIIIKNSKWANAMLFKILWNKWMTSKMNTSRWQRNTYIYNLQHNCNNVFEERRKRARIVLIVFVSRPTKCARDKFCWTNFD